MKEFKLKSPYKPLGDQPQAIDKLVEGLNDGKKHQVLLGATGTGKTFTIASIIHNLFSLKNIKKVLIIVPDNGLVTQFYDELVNIYKLNRKISKFYDKFNKLDEESEIIIANRPLLLSRFKQYEKIWKNEFDCLIVDEAHSIKRDNEISKCIAKIVTKYRFGFTGTLAERQEDKIKNLGLLRTG